MKRRRSPPVGRLPAVEVRSTRRRKPSSTRWLSRQLNDPYVAEARRLGYRSRAAFKLIELDERFRLLRPGQHVVEGQRLPDFHRRLLSDGGALYTQTLPGKAQRGMRALPAAAKPGREDVGLGRFGAARRRLGVAQLGEVALQRGEQLPLGTALKDFGDKGSAGREDL